MSRVKKLINISDNLIQVVHNDGNISTVPPGGNLENVDVDNLQEVKDQASVTMDLGEINESRPQKTKLFD